MSAQLIDTRATREPAPARDKRLTERVASRIGLRLLARGGSRYADAVIEGLGDPNKSGGVCYSCKRPHVQEWAVVEFGRAMNRAMGHPDVQVQVLNLIQHEFGCRDQNEARMLVQLGRSADALSDGDVAERAAEFLRASGWTVLAPGGAVASSGAAPETATIPGASTLQATDGTNGHIAP